MIARKYIEYGYKASVVLRIICLSRSTYYQRLRRLGITKRTGGGRPKPGYSFDIYNRSVSDEQIIQWIFDLVDSDAEAYGYLKLTYALKREYKLVINKKKVYRLCSELGILLPQREAKPQYPRFIARNRVITGPNQLWEADIKYGYIKGEQRYFLLLCILDVADRTIIDYHIGLGCNGHDAAITLKTAMLRRQLFNSKEKPVIRTDNGPQFISDSFEQACVNLSIYHERIPVKTPNKNAHIESFNRILEHECLKHYDFETYFDAYETVVEFIKKYNDVRLHSGTGFVPPREFYSLLKSGQKSIKMKV